MKTSTAMYAFLQAGGYLDKGPEEIKFGKKLYRRKFLREYKQKYRQENTEHTLLLKPKEEHLLSIGAKEHYMKMPMYIRAAAISYTLKKYLVPRLEAVYQLQQHFVYARTQIERIRGEKQGFFAKNKQERVEELLQSLEAKLNSLFHQPVDLEQEIRATVQKQPQYLEVLQKIIDDYKVDGK